METDETNINEFPNAKKETNEEKRHIIKVAMADDHALFRTGIKTSLSKRSDIQMVAEAENGLQLLNLLKHIQPDVVLLDIQMPIMDGLSTLPEIKKLYPEVKVIMLSMHNDHRVISRMMEIGASSYLTKESGSEMIYDAIRGVYENNFYFNDLTNKALLSGLRTKRSVESSLAQDVQLTEKEVLILKLMCDEKSTKEIADSVDLSPRTVEAVRDSLKLKTGVKSMAGLVMFAVKAGLVEQADSFTEEKNYEFSKEQIAHFFKLSISILSYINHDLAGQRTSIFYALTLIKEEIEQPLNENSTHAIHGLVDKALDATRAISSINGIIKSYFNLGISNDSSSFSKQFISRPNQIVEEIKRRYTEFKIDIGTSHKDLEITYPNIILYYILTELATNAKKHNNTNLEILIKWSVDNNIFMCEFHDNGKGFHGFITKKQSARTEIKINETDKDSGMGLKIIERTIIDSGGHLFFSNSEIKGGAKIYFDFPIFDFTDKKI